MMLRHESQKHVLTEGEKRERMTSLARTFPSLASHFGENESIGLDPWDSAKLATASLAWTSSQQQIVAFLLSVWNSKQALSAFNLVDAVSKWETGDREALVVWALEPFSF